MNISNNYNQNINMYKMNIPKTNNTNPNVNKNDEKSDTNKINNNLYIGKVGKGQDSRIKNLMKQKESIQERIEKLKQQKIEAKNPEDIIKQQKEKIEELQAQIQQIDNDIAQSKIEEQEKKEKEKPTENTQNTEEETLEDSIFSLDKNLSNIKQQNSVKTELQGRANILKIEIKLDASRKSSVGDKIEELAGLDAKILSLDKKVIDNLQKINDNTSQSNVKNNEDKNDKDIKEDTKTAGESTYQEKLVSKYTDNNKVIEKDDNTKIVDLEI